MFVVYVSMGFSKTKYFRNIFGKTTLFITLLIDKGGRIEWSHKPCDHGRARQRERQRCKLPGTRTSKRAL